ncbi:EamA family transporter RarD [Photobacterium sp. GJ3]|uniref:EamA family transporter RarD n=1 Tax=Photobacterium sp. GJ3 TaxID=2829502 RepID=UPI001B8C15F5|nr:EamA family transporter RarD [Photobacterium sp. GJ3]QUJ68532.1 EamA family transporter RarD [Photobacterium sp. GJ3]
MTMNSEQQVRQGVLYAIAAHTMWGVAPIYLKAVDQVSPAEILAHRVIWSFVLLALLLHFGRRWGQVIGMLRHKPTLICLLSTSVLIGVNWLTLIWGVNHHHMLDVSLGYYINPLLNVILGMIFFQERLRSFQWLAVGLAGIGVFIQLIAFGSIPVIAIVIALSFGGYGLLRKKVSVDSQAGLFIETMLMLPAAMIYLFGFANSFTSDLTTNSWTLNLLLFFAGVVTTAPLLCFTSAATRIKLSTLGFFQYIGPSLMLLLAVGVYGESFSLDKTITFGFIWTSLVIFSIDGFYQNRKSRQSQPAA